MKLYLETIGDVKQIKTGDTNEVVAQREYNGWHAIPNPNISTKLALRAFQTFHRSHDLCWATNNEKVLDFLNSNDVVPEKKNQRDYGDLKLTYNEYTDTLRAQPANFLIAGQGLFKSDADLSKLSIRSAWTFDTDSAVPDKLAENVFVMMQTNKNLLNADGPTIVKAFEKRLENNRSSDMSF